jgi:hypothetical protein
MYIDQQRLFSLISTTILDLNTGLSKLNGTGVFFAPELYLAFSIGMEIMKQSHEVFKVPDVYWDRERDLKNGGPSDIVFEQKTDTENKIISVIELKLRDTYDAYKADIVKLLRLNLPDCKRYFCVLLDSFTQENDDRLRKLESEFPGNIKQIGQNSFKVNQNWYKKQVYCVLNLYEVVN